MENKDWTGLELDSGLKIIVELSFFVANVRLVYAMCFILSSTIISARVLVVIIIFCGKLTCIIADDSIIAGVGIFADVRIFADVSTSAKLPLIN